MSLADAWEEHAQEWIAWARAPGHDGFWEGTWPELRRMLPPPGDLVVEVGCGEGRVCRQMRALGHRVLGVERSPTLADAASAGDPRVPVVRADAARLPVAAETVSIVVECMSLQDVDDLAATTREIARVLRAGGSLVVVLVHPVADGVSGHSGRPEVSSLTAPSVTLTEPYLEERRMTTSVERDGLQMTFVSTHRPLSAYVNALADAGLLLNALEESGQGVLPWLLVARAAKIAPRRR